MAKPSRVAQEVENNQDERVGKQYFKVLLGSSLEIYCLKISQQGLELAASYRSSSSDFLPRSFLLVKYQRMDRSGVLKIQW